MKAFTLFPVALLLVLGGEDETGMSQQEVGQFRAIGYILPRGVIDARALAHLE